MLPSLGHVLLLAAVSLAIAGGALLAYYGIDTYQRRRKMESIPLGVGSVPALGHLFTLLAAPEPWTLMLRWLNESGRDICRFMLPLDDWVVVRGGEAMRAVLQAQFRDFEKEKGVSFHPFLCILGSGLVTSEGQLWQSQRRLMTPAFKGDVLQEVIGISLSATRRLAAKLERCKASASTIEIDEEFRLLTLQVITEAIMSLHHEESDRVFPTLYLPIMEECHRRVLARWREYNPLDPAWWRHRAKTRKLDSYICKLIRDRWDELDAQERTAPAGAAATHNRDLLDLILRGKRAAGEAWSRGLQVQLCYELKTFLLAGHETSAAMLTFTLIELLKNDALRARVVAEADAVLGPDGTREPSRQEVEGMAVTEACLKETLRKYTVVPVITRVAQRDTTLCGEAVPRGAKVVLHLEGTHRHWREPDAYRPDRFLPGDEYDSFPESIRRFMFVPFGQGPRVCIGQHFSLMESRVVLAALLQRFTLELQRPYELEWCPNIIPLQPQGGVPVAVRA